MYPVIKCIGNASRQVSYDSVRNSFWTLRITSVSKGRNEILRYCFRLFSTRRLASNLCTQGTPTQVSDQRILGCGQRNLLAYCVSIVRSLLCRQKSMDVLSHTALSSSQSFYALGGVSQPNEPSLAKGRREILGRAYTS